MTSSRDGAFAMEELAAIEAIKQLKAQYCYCVDNKDWSRWGKLFAPDAWIDERDGIPEGMDDFVEWPLVGREAIQSFGETIAADNRTVHHVFTPEVELTSPKTATAVWPMEDYAWWPEGSAVQAMHGMGYYHETYERLDGQWYIKTIVVKRLFFETH